MWRSKRLVAPVLFIQMVLPGKLAPIIVLTQRRVSGPFRTIRFAYGDKIIEAERRNFIHDQ